MKIGESLSYDTPIAIDNHTKNAADYKPCEDLKESNAAQLKYIT